MNEWRGSVAGIWPSDEPFLTAWSAFEAGRIRSFGDQAPVIGGNAYGAPTSDNVSSQMFNSQQQAQAIQRQSRAVAHLHARQSKAAEAFERGVEADAEGDLRKARANYRKALATDQGPLRLQILSKMRARGWK